LTCFSQFSALFSIFCRFWLIFAFGLSATMTPKALNLLFPPSFLGSYQARSTSGIRYKLRTSVWKRLGWHFYLWQQLGLGFPHHSNYILGAYCIGPCWSVCRIVQSTQGIDVPRATLAIISAICPP
jgi:hypothetical protein